MTDKLIDNCIINSIPKNSKVVVAMSGGVDSSVTAAYLKSMGFEVIGVTMQLYKSDNVSNSKTCCAGVDIYDAKRVARQLDIAHYVVNYESNFKTEVIDYFVDSYIDGSTPVPCIACNNTVKFRDLYALAKNFGAKLLATGHYVRNIKGKDGFEIWRGNDERRDQSYFMFDIKRDKLDFLCFPLGDISKDKTRAMARQYGLKIAEKPDSQDICFVPDGKYNNLIKKVRPDALQEGDIVHIDGRVLGKHDSISQFTIGQRRKLGISSFEPLYVVAINKNNNIVTVGPKDKLLCNCFVINKINWLINKNEFTNNMRVVVKIRSNFRLIDANIYCNKEDSANVILDNPEYGISPGQACVFYQDERMIGGGWIV